MSDNNSNGTATSTDKKDARKQSLYLPEPLLAAIKEQAARLDRSVSWCVQRCIKLGIPELQKLQGMDDTDEG